MAEKKGDYGNGERSEALVLAGLKLKSSTGHRGVKPAVPLARRQGQTLSVIPPSGPFFIPISIIPLGKRAVLGVFIED